MISRKFKGKHLCQVLLFKKVAAARFTGDKLNAAFQNPALVVTLWNFAFLLYTSIGIYTNRYTNLSGFPGLTITV